MMLFQMTNQVSLRRSLEVAIRTFVHSSMSLLMMFVSVDGLENFIAKIADVQIHVMRFVIMQVQLLSIGENAATSATYGRRDV